MKTWHFQKKKNENEKGFSSPYQPYYYDMSTHTNTYK